MTKNSEIPTKGLLRFTTAGSVDDGKSTLIGRLLYDSKAIFDDQMEQLNESSLRRGKEDIDLSLLTDGLRAEREQGITIDVAYRYFATPKRKFIIADTPGHIQYTRNMVTGASTADLAVILVDARNGVLEQTRRHTFIASLLQIKHIIFCVNKMDLIHFNQEKFETIKQQLEELASQLKIKDATYIPISAKFGDNVVISSPNTPWYKGHNLLNTLETIKVYNDADMDNMRFAIQYVLRPQNDNFHDYRGYAGTVAGGVFTVGQAITVLPSMQQSKIKSIDKYQTMVNKAGPGESVSITLQDNIDISRGDMIVDSNNLPTCSQNIQLMICWFNQQKLQPGNKYILRHNTNEVRCIIKSVLYKMNISNLEKNYTDTQNIEMNDIACLNIKTTAPIFFDEYTINKTSGAIILIDETTNETMAAGMIYSNDIKNN
jgi:sulfate adenylyltransferase subunit 1